MEGTLAISVIEDAGLDARVDPRFGRAGGFLLIEAGGAAVRFLGNEGREAGHGAGTGAAAVMVEHGVTAVITGEVGPKAYQALDAAGIEMWLCPDGLTAGEALVRYRQGTLQAKRMQVLR